MKFKTLASAAIIGAACTLTIGAGDAHATNAGFGDVAGDGTTQSVEVVDGVLHVSFDDERPALETSVPSAEGLPTGDTVHLYDLDPIPGKEIVVDLGAAGAFDYFAVWTIRDGALQSVSGPGSAYDLTYGLWKLANVTVWDNIVCRDGGEISVFHVSPREGDAQVQDFTYSPPVQQVGDTSNYLPTGDMRHVARDEVPSSLSFENRFACTDGLMDADDKAVFG